MATRSGTLGRVVTDSAASNAGQFKARGTYSSEHERFLVRTQLCIAVLGVLFCAGHWAGLSCNCLEPAQVSKSSNMVLTLGPHCCTRPGHNAGAAGRDHHKCADHSVYRVVRPTDHYPRLDRPHYRYAYTPTVWEQPLAYMFHHQPARTHTAFQTTAGLCFACLVVATAGCTHLHIGTGPGPGGTPPGQMPDCFLTCLEPLPCPPSLQSRQTLPLWASVSTPWASQGSPPAPSWGWS